MEAGKPLKLLIIFFEVDLKATKMINTHLDELPVALTVSQHMPQ